MIRFLILLLALLAGFAPASADPLADGVRGDMPTLIALYRDLHRHPELANSEIRTAARLDKEMRALGFAVTPRVGGTGIVALLRNGPGPVLLLRTDMDGLPVTEATGLPFASVEAGVTHACGHDIHMASWIGTARRMAAMKAEWSGTLVMIAQPAEEVGGGARAMLDDGLFTRFPKPDAAIAFHDAADLPAGVIGYTPGYAFANVDSVDIFVKGVGGHGAYPQNTKDPILLAARIVVALQAIVAREIDPQDAAVVTVGSIHGGTKRSIIPDEVKLELTVRSYTPEMRTYLFDAITRVARGEAIATGVPEDRMPIVAYGSKDNTPAALNTEPITNQTVTLFRARFGTHRVLPVKPSMAGEDFGRYRLADPGRIQSLLFWVGGVPQAKWDAAGGDASKLPSLHSPLWAPDSEPTIAAAVEAMTSAAFSLLRTDIKRTD